MIFADDWIRSQKMTMWIIFSFGPLLLDPICWIIFLIQTIIIGSKRGILKHSKVELIFNL